MADDILNPSHHGLVAKIWTNVGWQDVRFRCLGPEADILLSASFSPSSGDAELGGRRVRPQCLTAREKALARAHRWRRMLESGEFATVQDLANAEKINSSYLARVLRLTLLAPDIVEEILDGRQPAGLQLEDLLAPFPVEWERQKSSFMIP